MASPGLGRHYWHPLHLDAESQASPRLASALLNGVSEPFCLSFLQGQRAEVKHRGLLDRKDSLASSCLGHSH